MTDENKSSIITLGIVAIASFLFAYLIYSSNKNQSTPPVTQPVTQPQPAIQFQPSTPQTIDNTLLYRLEFQSQQLADNLKILQEQQKILQEQLYKLNLVIIRLFLLGFKQSFFDWSGKAYIN